MGEHPATALRTKRRSSIVVATDLVRDGSADAVVSAGSTGCDDGRRRLPARTDRGHRPSGAAGAHGRPPPGPVMLLDVGANVDSDPENLVQFAAMGAIFAEHVLHVSNPRIGLLNIGEEVEKGDELAREAHAKLAALDLHFVGNVEAHDMIAHRADVVVCDGFVGNVVIKFFEGITSFIFRALREDLQQGPIAPLALLALKPGFDRMRARFDYERYGGAPLLGVKGVSIVTHGRARGTHDRERDPGRVRVGRGARARADRAVDARAPGARASRRALAHRRPAAPGSRLTMPTRTGRGRQASRRRPARPPPRPAGAVRGRVPARQRGRGARAAGGRAGRARRGPRRMPRAWSTASPSTATTLDRRIAAEAPLIPVPELGRVERTILRSAIYEVLYSAATPSGETMRDAVSLARIYAGDAARRLVNGVLGSVSRSSGGGA